ncbi:DUF7848 domain-containing protein [Streptomyces odontomachi]|uniref:DUF7848 domain-containing protein n=1 Tax=Streptomyces odontomachi TaxID=2944940 RepID=UPI00210D31B2|nr:hypothetical protein [Streptomyces sp. ODS25]
MTGSASAEWMLGPERDDEGHMTVRLREVQCRDCGETSGANPEQGVTDRWALRHTVDRGHRYYREIISADLVTQPAPTNPLYEQETVR